MGRKESRLVVCASSSSTPAWSRSETGGKSSSTARCGENFASAATKVHAMITPEPGEEYATDFRVPAPPLAEAFAAFRPGRGNSTVSSSGIQEVDSPLVASAPLRSITVAPELCATGQLRTASCCEPAKNTKRASSKLSSESARIKVGSPPASVSVPASPGSSRRTISLAGKLRSSRTSFNSLPRREEAPTMATRVDLAGPAGMVLGGPRSEAMSHGAHQLHHRAVQHVSGSEQQQGSVREIHHGADQKREQNYGERRLAARERNIFEAEKAQRAGH